MIKGKLGLKLQTQKEDTYQGIFSNFDRHKLTGYFNYNSYLITGFFVYNFTMIKLKMLDKGGKCCITTICSVGRYVSVNVPSGWFNKRVTGEYLGRKRLDGRPNQGDPRKKRGKLQARYRGSGMLTCHAERAAIMWQGADEQCGLV